MNTASNYRNIKKCKRLVLKAGTHVLINETGNIDEPIVDRICQQIVELVKHGIEVIFVTSGAIGIGTRILGWQQRPTAIPDLQMAAAIGQSHLLSYLQQRFSAANNLSSQVLLTHSDLNARQRHLNARNMMLNLLKHNAIPIINENDVVAVDEIKLGDNDVLAAMVSIMLNADHLLLLTSAPGVMKNNELISTLENPHEIIAQHIQPTSGTLSVGGMATKIKAAVMASETGSEVFILNGKQPALIPETLTGNPHGTWLPANHVHHSQRKNWLTYFHRTNGSLIIDDGAAAALTQHHKSLLPSGIIDVIGNFQIGDMVTICNSKQQLLGHGLVEYEAKAIQAVKGKQTHEIPAMLGYKSSDEIIHRDNLIILADTNA